MKDTLLKIERLHRFVFDNLYIQKKKIYSEQELERKNEYEDLINDYPHWRVLLKQLYLKNPTSELKKILRVHKNTTRYGLL